MKEKYVVSGDICLLLEKWAKGRGLLLPPNEFFEKIRTEFCSQMRAMFDDFDFVTEEELSGSLLEIVQAVDMDIVSLERVYLKPETFLDITRSVQINPENNQIVDAGLESRYGFLSVSDQLMSVKKKGLTEIALLDDVIFSGEFLEKVIKEFDQIGVKVPLVIAGIGISEGINRLEALGIEVRCVRSYDNVIDEVCERDFYPGIPYSGRSVVGDSNSGIPYILPYGKLVEWASIPVSEHFKFSKFCLEQSISLFEAIEDVNGKEIRCNDLDRQIVSPWDGRVVDKLKRDLHILISEWSGDDTGS